MLAIHPNYLVRNMMIKEMRERWIEIYPKGHRYIAIGLLRDGQYEMALDKLDSMVKQGMTPEPWFLDLFIYVFGKLEFFDEALRIARYRDGFGIEVPVNVWYYLLDVCSKGQHHEATTHVWNRTVPQGIINPSDGVCLNVLNMAAVHGDTDLATQVIQFLANRGTRLARPHYEALAEAYTMQGTIERAIEVYCIMHGAGAEVSPATTGTLCQVLARDPHLIDQAVEAMISLKHKYRIPVGVYNAVLSETAKSSALPPADAFVKALDLYRRLRDFLPAGPNQDTFRALLRHCTNPDVAQFLLGEMLAFGLRPGLRTTELVFKVDVERAGPSYRAKKRFYEVAPHLRAGFVRGTRRWRNFMELALGLVRRLIAEEDPEAWRILEVCKRNGLEEGRILALKDEVEGRSGVVEGGPVVGDRTPRVVEGTPRVAEEKP